MTTLSFEKADQLREFFFALIESIPGGLLLADRQGVVLAANRQSGLLLGISGAALVGRSCWELIAGSLKFNADKLEPLKQAGGRVLLEPDTDDENAEPFCLLFARNELQSPFLGVEGFFLSIEDITYPLMVESHLDRRKRFAAIQDITVLLSQELRNPLGGLEIYASMLNRDLADDPDYRRITNQMMIAVRSINHLLANALTFVEQPKPSLKQFCLQNLLDKVIAELSPLGEANGVIFLARYNHLQENIVADPELIEQVMLNLATNSLESMEGRGEVELYTRSLAADKNHPAMIEIRFRDQGKGISPEDCKRIFDPFFTTKHGGRGLGLAIAHQVVESHQGFIRVESKPGRGSAFSVFLPLFGV